MEWFEEFGFVESPFGTDAAFSARFSAGLERQLEQLQYLVKAGSFVFLEGPGGCGKSVLLRMLIGKLGRKAIYVDGSASIDVEAIIKRRTSIFRSMIGKSPSNLVLLVDGVSGLSPAALEMVKYNYDNNLFAAVVIAAQSMKSAGLPASILDRIGSRVVRIEPISEGDALIMVRKRLGSFDLLSDELVRKIYKKSGGNAKIFLGLCEEAGKQAAASRSTEIMEEHLKVR